MLPAKLAVLLHLKSVRCLLFVLRRRIVPVLAICTCKYHQLPHLPSPLFYYLRAHPGTDGLAAFPDGEAELFLEGDGGDQLDGDGHVVTGHDHLDPFGKLYDTGHVRGSEVELGTVAGEEGGMTATLFLVKDVDLALELRMGGDGTGFGEDLASFHFIFLDATEEDTDVVACLTLVEDLAEHLDGGGNGLQGGPEADDLHFLAGLDDASFHPAGDDGTTTGDGEDVFYGHEEGLVRIADRLGDVGVTGIEELEDALAVGAVRLAVSRIRGPLRQIP